eukprot:gb/GEZN01008074.1/.p1 GENE.gb/GEZN01008074.1/~~gb/GEZN01008074.1/.p1  ORF type:complete len:406 (-),score=102.59 gb/GEZN01008074.1/:214-1431(-)
MVRKFSPEVVKSYAEWLRGSKMVLHDGVCSEKRVQFFSGAELHKFFMANQNKRKKTPGLDILDDNDFNDLCNRMIKLGFFHRATIRPASKKRDYILLQYAPGVFNVNMCKGEPSGNSEKDGGVFVWILEPSQFKAFVYSFGLLFGLLVVFMFKVWPLWAKLAIWWLALIFLVSMLGILFVRLPVTAVLWILGFRGMWMFPNILNEEIGVMDTFTPVFGYGIEEDERRRRVAETKARKKRAAEGPSSTADTVNNSTTANSTTDSDDSNNNTTDKAEKDDGSDSLNMDAVRKKEEAKKAEAAKEAEDSNWKFGFINFILLIIVGLVACQQFGLMSADMIPEMFVSREEIYNTYPSLLTAAPEPVDEEVEEEADKDGGTAKEGVVEKSEEELRMEELVDQELAAEEEI